MLIFVMGTGFCEIENYVYSIVCVCVCVCVYVCLYVYIYIYIYMNVILQGGERLYHSAMNGNHFYRLVESLKSCRIFSFFIYIVNIF